VGWPAAALGCMLVTLARAAGGCPEAPRDQWVTAPAAVAADTASAVTAVALAGLPCSADGLRCRLGAAGRAEVAAASGAAGEAAAGRGAEGTVCGSLRCRARPDGAAERLGAVDGPGRAEGRPGAAGRTGRTAARPGAADGAHRAAGRPGVADGPSRATGRPGVADGPGRAAGRPGAVDGPGRAAGRPDLRCRARGLDKRESSVVLAACAPLSYGGRPASSRAAADARGRVRAPVTEATVAHVDC
jgi:hypothetical protein